MFAAILLSQFNLCPGITIATDDVITTTDDVINTNDDVIHIICIDLDGKLMCCLFLGQKIHFKFIFLELYMEILMQQLLNNNQKYVVRVSSCQKKYFIKKRFLATILQNDRPQRSLDGLYIINQIKIICRVSNLNMNIRVVV